MVAPVVTAAALAIIPQLGGGLVSVGLTQGARFPGVSPGDFVRLATGVRDLRARGLQPVITTDPITGNFVLSTADQQFASQIAATLAERQFGMLTPDESREIFNLRQGFIESRRINPVFPVVQQVSSQATLPVAAQAGPALVAPVDRGTLSAGTVIRRRVTNRSLCLAGSRNLAEIARCQGGF